MNEVSLWQAGLYSYIQSEILKIYTDVVKKEQFTSLKPKSDTVSNTELGSQVNSPQRDP